MKILSIDEMLDVAFEVLPRREYKRLVRGFESAATELGQALARRLKVRIAGRATFESGFGGTCVCFRPKAEGQSCPDVLAKADPGGDWE